MCAVTHSVGKGDSLIFVVFFVCGLADFFGASFDLKNSPTTRQILSLAVLSYMGVSIAISWKIHL